MLVARPVAVFLCLAPFRFTLREKTIHLVGRPARRGRHLPGVDPAAGRPAESHIYFDIAFVVVLVSLLVQGWTLAFAARPLAVALPRIDAAPRRVELDLPGQLEQELVGYPVTPNSLYLPPAG